jgi:CRISPR/Cas system-associated exonuclease Cas4 (RecB family)
MKPLVNEFTWSVSRNSQFQDCRRAYYYQYYGSWNGWDAAAPERTRRIYLLKNLKTLDMWGGTIVHDTIAEALRRYSTKAAPITAAELQATARQKLRAGWLEAVNGEWRTSPKKTNLTELFYGNGKSLPPEQTERIKEKIYDCLRAFAESALLRQIQAATYLAWKPVDKLDSFLLGETKVWCAVDFAYTDPAGALRILDWKTGGENEDALQLQLACYAYFAADKWRAKLETLRVYGVFLRDNAREKEYPLTPEILVEARERMLQSAAEMRKFLRDPQANEPLPEEEFPLCTRERTCARCNYRELCPGAPKPPPAAVPAPG